VCKAGRAKGLNIASLSRSGAPAGGGLPGVEYLVGDVFGTAWPSYLAGCSAVISCIGGFGNNAAMERINGTANEVAIAAAAAAGIPRFVFVSVHEYNLPGFVTGSIGYFTGKRSAERAVLASFPDGGYVLRPGFIYGKRLVGSQTLPLDLVGRPLEAALEGGLGRLLSPLRSLPGSDVLLAPPVSVEAVAAAAVACAAGEPAPAARVLDIAAIKACA
jgi:nucleoside-diphosphate-sugar epimerase